MNALVASLSLTWLFCFGLFGLLLAAKGLKKREGDASFLRFFPSEYYSPKDAPLSFSCFCLSSLSFFVPLSYLLNSLDLLPSSFRAYISFALLSSALLLVLHVSLILLSPSNEKLHFGLFLGTSALSSLSFAMHGLTYLSLRDVASSFAGMVSIAVLYFVLALASVSVLLNPKLKRWYALEAKDNPDGTVSYVRPKVFPLALSEWILYLLFSLGSLFGDIALLFF